MKSTRSAATRLRRSFKPQTVAEAENPVDSRVKGLELDLHLREFEINQLTQRNNFFMLPWRVDSWSGSVTRDRCTRYYVQYVASWNGHLDPSNWDGRRRKVLANQVRSRNAEF